LAAITPIILISFLYVAQRSALSVVKIFVIEKPKNKIFEPPRTQRAQRKAKYVDYPNLVMGITSVLLCHFIDVMFS